MEDKDYLEFMRKMNQLLGIDLSLYKGAQMNRRMRALYEKRGCRNFEEYYRMLVADPKLMREFLERMTINVTEFFRNPERWHTLQNRWSFELRKEKDSVKCWSAACSTGEEPYTLAMILLDRFNAEQVRITATDIDEGVLEKAKAGRFSERSMTQVPARYKAKYFKKDEQGAYQISEEVKKCVTFDKHDLLKGVYGSGYDLIICRNVLIYFTEEAKEGLYKKFNTAMAADGLLFVGSTEQIFQPERYRFTVYDPFIYQKKGIN